MRIRHILTLTIATTILFLVYLITSAGKTPYDYYLRLADAFLKGQYWLSEQPSWLSELVPAGQNRYYTVFPPMPSILSLPLVFFWGVEKFHQEWLAHAIGAGIALLTGLLAYRISRKRSIAIWAYLLSSVGCINWYMAATGSVWYLGQITSEFFILAALVESFGRKRPFLVGIFLGAAYLSRLQSIVAIPLFIFLLRKKIFNNRLTITRDASGKVVWTKLIRAFIRPALVAFGGGLAIFFWLNAMYNFVRYGSFFDVGYVKIPGLFSEPWYPKGLFHWSYIAEHLRVLFTAQPRIIPEFPYIRPSWGGLAIWITTPAFILALRANLRERLVLFCWLAIILVSLVDFSHGGTGWTQFGYRYAVDFYPYLFVLTIKGVGRRLDRIHWALLIVGILVNLWGVLWINKFGWINW